MGPFGRLSGGPEAPLPETHEQKMMYIWSRQEKDQEESGSFWF